MHDLDSKSDNSCSHYSSPFVCVCVCVFCSDRTAAVLPMTKSYTNWVTQLDVV